jgi:quinolinate synthase
LLSGEDAISAAAAGGFFNMTTTLQSPPPAHQLQPYKSLSNEELTARIQTIRKQLGPKLLILGHHYQQDEVIALADLRTERGVECPGDLPGPSDRGLVERARVAKAALGERVFVLGHHYQRDEVIEFADVTGDSFKLAKEAAARPHSPWIVFCGVHFMAESADILTSDQQAVVLPDLAAGCSMADMAAIHQIEDAWDQLGEVLDTNDITPVTYINSAASLKAFVGRHGGIVCTSSNAEAALKWSFARTGKVMFFPDQHPRGAVLQRGPLVEHLQAAG